MKKCELLAPAGGIKQFIAAVENGADAVYIGAKSFSARNRAENFSPEEAERAMDYGHLRGVKTYVAMNTLLSDEEIEKAVAQAEVYRRMGVDAIIIQDLGLGAALQREMPDLPLHLSTQAGIFDARGVMAAEKLGYERVVMARELSVDEIYKAVQTGVEIEVFVHGAMCICCSGQCQLSRFIGGRSGNRGECAQPCRLPYGGSGDGAYLLSPKDLCLVEYVGKLMDMGVASLKIEGRMKSPEYVAQVTAIYRKYMDMCLSGKETAQPGQRNSQIRGKVDPRDIERLKQIYNRGGFSEGYIKGDPGSGLMSPKIPKNEGIYAGVTSKDSKGSLVEIKTDLPLAKNDYIEIRDAGQTSALITYVESRGEGRMIVGDIKAPVCEGSPVYRLASAQQLEDVRETFEKVELPDGEAGCAAGSARKVPVDMELTAEPGKPARLVVRGKGFADRRIETEVFSEIKAQAACRKEGCAERAAQQLRKTGGTDFEARDVLIVEPEPSYLPVSAVNDMRRRALTRLRKEILRTYKKKPGHIRNPEMDRNMMKGEQPIWRRQEEECLELYFYGAESLLNSAAILREAKKVSCNILALIPLWDYIGASGADKQSKIAPAELKDFARRNGVGLRPYISSADNSPGSRWLTENFNMITETLVRDGCGICVGNLGLIAPFREDGAEVWGDFGLNVTNKEAREACRRLGIRDSALSLELAEKAQGAYPLMISGHSFDIQTISDRKGAVYNIHFDRMSHKSIITAGSARIDWKRIEDLWKKGKKIRVFVPL